jgi:hypothetical protein
LVLARQLDLHVRCVPWLSAEPLEERVKGLVGPIL